MFEDETVSNFDEKEANLYVKALFFLACADGLVQDREREFIESQLQLIGTQTDLAEITAEPDAFFLKHKEMSRAKRIALLRDCMILATVDGLVDDFERRTLHEMARILDISQIEMERLEKWVHSRRPI